MWFKNEALDVRNLEEKVKRGRSCQCEFIAQRLGSVLFNQSEDQSDEKHHCSVAELMALCTVSPDCDDSMNVQRLRKA